jgi:glycerol kinase
LARHLVLAIDAGSTGVRALVVDREGRVRGRGYREIASAYPLPGRVEQDPEAIARSSLEVAREALERAGARPAEIAALGLTGQRSTAVAWSRREDRPLAAALSWQDLRAARRCEELFERGFALPPIAAALKLEWLAKNSSEVREALRTGDACLGTLESWLLWRLSGGKSFATDPSFASATGLFDLPSGHFHRDLLAALDLPAGALPEIRPSSGDFGTTDPSLLGASIPLAGLAGDQQAAAFGQACFSAGDVKVSYGTAAILDVNVGASARLSSGGAYPLVLWEIPSGRQYCLEAQVSTAGAAVQWLRDGLGILETVADSDRIARSVSDTAGVWAVPAFQGLGTPHLRAGARAAFGGLSRGSTRAHLVRAVLEGIAFRCREAFEALLAGLHGASPDTLRADGQAAANDFLLQFQADVLGLPVERPSELEASATGAAFLAGLAAGVWEEPAEIARLRRVGARFEPRMSADEREERYARFRAVVERVREL